MNIKEWWLTLREARKIAKQKHIEAVAATEKANIAKVFNDLYTYREPWNKSIAQLTEGSAMYGVMPKGGYAWMCPTCNSIHHPYECSVFDGLHYPSCCEHAKGNRVSRNIRTR